MLAGKETAEIQFLVKTGGTPYCSHCGEPMVLEKYKAPRGFDRLTGKPRLYNYYQCSNKERPGSDHDYYWVELRQTVDSWLVE